jgi:hypothetical protein
MSDGVVIAGGGLAAERAAETLRRLGYAAPVRMVCAEPHLPYDRPPLSKDLLSGERTDGSVRFRLDGWYEERDIDVLLGVSATGLNTSEQRLELSDGNALRYEQLLIATGSKPRQLPLLVGYENVSELRTLDDALRLRGALTPGAQLVIIGAGFVGLEVASIARRLGVQVTIVEAAPKPLVGVLGDEMASWLCELHRAEGVEVLTGRTAQVSAGRPRWLCWSSPTDERCRQIMCLSGSGCSQPLSGSRVAACRAVEFPSTHMVAPRSKGCSPPATPPPLTTTASSAGCPGPTGSRRPSSGPRRPCDGWAGAWRCRALELLD